MLTKLRAAIGGIALAASLALTPVSAAPGDTTESFYASWRTDAIIGVFHMETGVLDGTELLGFYDEDTLREAFGYGVDVSKVRCHDDLTDRRFARRIGMEDADCYYATDGGHFAAIIVAADEWNVAMVMVTGPGSGEDALESVPNGLDLLADAVEDGVIDELPYGWFQTDNFEPGGGDEWEDWEL